MKTHFYLKISMLSLLLILLSGCSKQKAEAIKIAAENFRADAVVALDKMNFLFTQSLSVVKLDESEEIDKILKDLNSFENPEDISAEVLDFWAEEAVLGDNAQEIINKEFEEIKSQYYQFEAIFTSLDKGSYFAAESVKKAEKYAINLSLQMINYSRIVNNDFQFTSRRVLIIEKMRAAKAEQNSALQQELLKTAAAEFISLKNEEQQLKNETIRQCLKAAESGKVVAELIRGYDKMDLNDILNTIKSSMSFALEVTNGNQSIKNLMSKFEGVETTIKADPYWKALLDQNIIAKP